MANEKRLIDANAMREDWLENGENEYVYDTNAVLASIDAQPTVDAVEVERLGKLGQLMMPYHGCPRGALGYQGEPGNGVSKTLNIMELDAISDVDGNRWVPVLDGDLAALKAKAKNSMEVVHGRWLPDMEEFDDDPAVGIRGGVFQTGWKCSICGRSERVKEPYCNCGAKMDGDGNDI